MEIIFTLILLIGFGINSHRYEAKKYESQQELTKQVVTSYIQQEIEPQVFNKGKAVLNHMPENLNSVTSTTSLKSNTAKGKYISFRINDDKG